MDDQTIQQINSEYTKFQDELLLLKKKKLEILEKYRKRLDAALLERMRAEFNTKQGGENG